MKMTFSRKFGSQMSHINFNLDCEVNKFHNWRVSAERCDNVVKYYKRKKDRIPLLEEMVVM
jgi:hypothetical protein